MSNFTGCSSEQTPMRTSTYKITAILILLSSLNGLAQDSDQDDSKPVKRTHKKGFEFGVSMGTYFANNYTASLYNGYGFDVYGNPNKTFGSSAMNEKINYEYAGGNGYPDRIAQYLSTPGSTVQPGAWSFDSTDMPGKMRYTIAFELGIQTRYFVNDRNAVVFNLDAAQLTVSGAFTIGFANTVIKAQTPDSLQIQAFNIVGQEERLIFQPGWQHIFGDDDQFNFFIEGGPIVTMAKFQKNELLINGNPIDLRTYYNPYGYITQTARNMTGVGFGAFAGFGLNLQLNEKYALQLLYNPSFEKIALGPNPPFTLQNSIQFRICYKLK